ncbi:MAG: hypothetical protein ABJY83_13520 [Roseibium sp.]
MKSPVNDREIPNAGKPEAYERPELDENRATALCYLSGTTGNLKGALYSHRETV